MENDTCKYKVLAAAEEAWRKPSLKLITRRKSGFLWNPSLGYVTIWCETEEPSDGWGFHLKDPDTGLYIDFCLYEGCTPELVKNIISTKCLDGCNWAAYVEDMTELMRPEVGLKKMKKLFKKSGWLWCDNNFDYGCNLEDALAAVAPRSAAFQYVSKKSLLDPFRSPYYLGE